MYGLPSTGGAGTIAIIGAYDDPTVEGDLGVFSSTYGLPACTTANGCFSQGIRFRNQAALNCGWAQETGLDVEWAHATAPNARIVLVEAASNSSTDLFRAIDVASSIVSPGGRGFGKVSTNWGFADFSGRRLSTRILIARASYSSPQAATWAERAITPRPRLGHRCGWHHRTAGRNRQVRRRDGLERKWRRTQYL